MVGVMKEKDLRQHIHESEEIHPNSCRPTIVLNSELRVSHRDEGIAQKSQHTSVSGGE